MTRYNQSGQIGHLGKDKPATDVQESIPFVVDYREDVDLLSVFGPGTGLPDTVDFVDIGISSGEHGSHVAGIVAANDLFGGKMDGQAPGAKLVSARACAFGAGCTNAALTDGMAELALNRGVDIINMSIGGLPSLNDGDNARADLYNAIINQLGVQLVISAGNSSAALNTIGDPAVATDVVAVGADITKETWQANYGSTVDFNENIMPSRPAVLARTVASSRTSRRLVPPSRPRRCGCPVHRLLRRATTSGRATPCCRARRWPRLRRPAR